MHTSDYVPVRRSSKAYYLSPTRSTSDNKMEKDGENQNNHPEAEVVTESAAGGDKEKQLGKGYSRCAKDTTVELLLR